MTTCLAFSFWNFFKNTWASSNRFLNRSKPTPKLLFTAFHRVPFTLFFPIFFEILPSSSNYNCLLPSSFPRNIQLLSTFSSNLFSNQSPFPRIIKKKKEKIFPIKKKKKTKVVEFYPRGDFRGIIFDRRRGAYSASFRLTTRSIFFNARGRTRASAWSRTKRVWLL